MTKKDYQIIADTIAQGIDRAPWASRKAIWNIVYDLASEFEKDNPRFDRTKFHTACGIKIKDGKLVKA